MTKRRSSENLAEEKGINLGQMNKKRSLENLAEKMGYLFGSEGIFLKTGKMGRRENAFYKLGMGPPMAQSGPDFTI